MLSSQPDRPPALSASPRPLAAPVNATLVIARKELASAFHSLIAYVALGVFSLALGLFFWVFKGNVLETGLAELDALYDFGPWLLLLLVPALTMRSFADEFRMGTYEWLVTRPVTVLQLLAGKFTAVGVLVALALTPGLLYYATLSALGNPPGSLDSGAALGNALGLLLIGLGYAAIGLWASTLTDNQIVAFLLALFVSFVVLQGFAFVAELPGLTAESHWIMSLGMEAHYRSLGRGVVDSRDVLYFASVIAAFGLLAYLNLEGRRP